VPFYPRGGERGTERQPSNLDTVSQRGPLASFSVLQGTTGFAPTSVSVLSFSVHEAERKRESSWQAKWQEKVAEHACAIRELTTLQTEIKGKDIEAQALARTLEALTSVSQSTEIRLGKEKERNATLEAAIEVKDVRIRELETKYENIVERFRAAEDELRAAKHKLSAAEAKLKIAESRASADAQTAAKSVQTIANMRAQLAEVEREQQGSRRKPESAKQKEIDSEKQDGKAKAGSRLGDDTSPRAGKDLACLSLVTIFFYSFLFVVYILHAIRPTRSSSGSWPGILIFIRVIRVTLTFLV
jgi:hypothetical protein